MPIADALSTSTGLLIALRRVFAEVRPAVQAIVCLRVVAGGALAAYACPPREPRDILAFNNNFVLLCLSWASVTCAIYLYNGVQDVEEDRSNESRRPIASGALSVRFASVGVGIFAVLGVTGVGVAETHLIWAALSMLILGWLYSGPPCYLKRSPVGMALVVALSGMLTYFVGYFPTEEEGSVAQFLLFGGSMAAWMGLVGQTKDLSDVIGDGVAGRRSLPIVWGQKRARAFMVVAATVIGLGFLSLSLCLANELVPSAIAVCVGAILVGISTLGRFGRGPKSDRSPYRAFMITQYASNILVIVPAF